MLDFIERVLRRRFTITRTNSPEAAIEYINTGEYEVLITDQQMPKVSGLDLLGRIAHRFPALVRILISGFTEVPDIQRAVEQGTIHNYILKPVDSQKLIRGVEQAFQIRDSRLGQPSK